MSKITICEGEILYTSKGDTIIHAFDGNITTHAQEKNMWEGKNGTLIGDYIPMQTLSSLIKSGGPIITITNEAIGWGHIKLIGVDNRKNKGSYITIGVPLYKMIVTHETDKNFHHETMVSRDSWIVNKIEGKVAEILNCAFEPKANNTYKGVYIDVYPHHNDTAGYKLEQSNSDTLESEERYNDNRQKVTVAKSIMIHVGGYYHNEKDSTYDNKPRTRAGGSLGCFGITNKNNSIKNPADKETKSIIDKIREKSDEDTIFGYSDVTIIIQKRNNVERIKKVNLPY